MKTYLISLLFVFSGLLGCPLAARGDTPQTDPTLPVIVKYKAQPAAALSTFEKHLGILGRARFERAGVTGLKLTAGASAPAFRPRFLAHLRLDKNVEYAEPNYIRHPIGAIVPNDPDYSSQYAPQIIDAPDAWSLVPGQSSVIIAVIDSGVDATDPDLAGHVLPGIDDAIYPAGVAATGAQHDAIGHGTHVAGIIAGTRNNGVGIAGISSSTVLPIKVFPDVENASDLTISGAIRDAVAAGAQVINLSLGGPGSSLTLSGAIAYAWSKGCVIVAAAGNDGSNETFLPADLPNVIAVAATNSTDGIPSYSNYGPSITVAAPGDTIFSTLPGNTYGYMSGTSMASPCVAGVAGLAFAYAKASTNAQVVAAIESGVDKVGTYAYDATGRNDHYGYGRVNAYKTLIALKPSPVVPRPVITYQVRYWPRDAQPGRMVGGKFQVSKDNVTYTDVATVTAVPPIGAWSTLPVSVDLSQYRYLRYLSPLNGWGNVNEVEFDAISGGVITKLTGTPFGTAGSYRNSGNTFDKALDGNTTTFFDAPSNTICVIGLDTGAK